MHSYVYFSTPLTFLLFNILRILNLSDKYSKLILLYATSIFFAASQCALSLLLKYVYCHQHTQCSFSARFQSLFSLSLSSKVRLLPCLLPCALPPPPSLNTLQRFSLFPVFYFPSPVRLKEDFHFSSFVKETVGVGDHRSIFILAYSFALLQLPCKTVHVGNTSQVSCAVSS